MIAGIASGVASADRPSPVVARTNDRRENPVMKANSLLASATGFHVIVSGEATPNSIQRCSSTEQTGYGRGLGVNFAISDMRPVGSGAARMQVCAVAGAIRNDARTAIGSTNLLRFMR
jgi:hypothetical protein